MIKLSSRVHMLYSQSRQVNNNRRDASYMYIKLFNLQLEIVATIHNFLSRAYNGISKFV